MKLFVFILLFGLLPILSAIPNFIFGLLNRKPIEVIVGILTPFGVWYYFNNYQTITTNELNTAMLPAFVSMGLVGLRWWDRKPFFGRFEEVKSSPEREPEPEPKSEPQPEPQPEPYRAPDPKIPEDLRTTHAMIVATTGHGKTQLLQSLILDDLDQPGAMVVIDSQPQFIKGLINAVPANRLVHLTPTDEDYPLALNLFDKKTSPELYEYIFSSLGATMTSKQSTMYRYISRLVALIPSGNIMTMLEILDEGDIAKYGQYISELNVPAQKFFKNAFHPKAGREYTETRSQISRRLYTLLENEFFLAMFSSPTMKLDMKKELNDGKVILIDTAKRKLRGDAFSVLGRFFIAQIANAMFEREHPYRHRVHIYIDEFQEYAGEEGFVTELFTQARKINVSLNVAFQYVDQIPDGVRNAIMSNTSAKIAGRMSAADTRLMSKEMRIEDWLFNRLAKGNFLARFEGHGHHEDLNVRFGRLEDMGVRTKAEHERIRETMRERYHYEYTDEVPETKPKDDFGDFKDAD